MDSKRSARAARLHWPQLRRLSVVAAILAAFLAATPVASRELVGYGHGYAPGTIVVSTSQRRLYLIGHGGTAISYPVGVGRLGKQWFGMRAIDGKYVYPSWAPPAEVKRDNPRVASFVAGGSPHNPMGSRALTLSGGAYAIHGTNQPRSIGTYASYGCIRMHNHDIEDLFERVGVGTRVVVTR